LDFDIAVEKKLGISMTKDDFKDDPDFTNFETPTCEPYEDDEVPASKMSDIDDVDNYDQYGVTQVRVPIGDEIWTGKVMWYKRELDGTVKGRANANSMLDIRTLAGFSNEGDEERPHCISDFEWG
jgi:hypothetical protein